MSTEAPRNSGTGESIPPRKPDCGFKGFLRGFFGVPSKPQLTQQPTLGIVQLPPELSDFAARINKGVEDGLSMAQQAELRRDEHDRQSAEKRAKEKEAREQQIRQLIESRLQTLDALKQIAEDLKIRDRLAYINATVWEGKGVVREISTDPKSAYNGVDSTFSPDREPQTGFELTFSYPSAVEERGIDVSKGRSHGYNWRFIQGLETTSLRVLVQSWVDYGKKESRCIDVFSPYVGKENSMVDYRGINIWGTAHGYIGRVQDISLKDFARISLEPLDREGVEEKLSEVLVNESITRAREGVVPSKLILAGQARLKQAKASPQWMKWEYRKTSYSEPD